MRKLTTVLILFLIFTACNEMQMQDVIHDLTGAPEGMVLIPAGEVSIGLSQHQLALHKVQYGGDASLTRFTEPLKPTQPSYALPYQTVYVDAFYMDRYEVTWRNYIDFVEASGYESGRVAHTLQHFSDKVDDFKDEPITQLTIAEMEAYAEWHGKELPTEIEWEKAARGGLMDMVYPWGNEIDHTKANYNHEGILNVFVSDGSGGWVALISPTDVGQYAPNGYGLYDMAGNVSEYVVTEHDTIASNQHDQVISRGGNYRRPGFECQTWWRAYYGTGPGSGTIGFRCVKRIN